MSLISSTTLFNFTTKLNYLIDNLQNGIFCKNIYEKLPLRNNGYRIPMACFCDIPLSLIKDHFDWYGRYGIGIRRSYARKFGVKPIWYVTSENNIVKNLVKKSKLTFNDKCNLLPYLKQFMGTQMYNDENLKRKKFYDEREWRYIPNSTLIEPLFNIRKDEIPANKIKPLRFKIDNNEIEYIIIKNSKDVDKLLKALKKISNLTNVKYEQLVTKIITARQIEKDF